MAHHPAGMPRWGYVQTAGQVLASPGSSVCDSATFLPPHTHTAYALPQPPWPKLAPHTAPVSRLEGVTVPVSPQPVQQSPRGTTMVHTFSPVPHVGLGKAQCPADAPGDEPAMGLGLLQHLPLSHKA